MDCLMLLTFVVPIVCTAVSAVPGDEKQVEIAALEKEKSALYKEINDAIDDSVSNLQLSNDSDAQQGVSLITELKRQLQELNGTNADEDENKDSSNETRRFYKYIQMHPDTLYPYKNGTRKWKGLDEVFTDKLYVYRDLTAGHKKRYANREEMQEKVRIWLNKKEAEKRKKKLQKYKAGVFWEKCPNQGTKRKKGKHKKNIVDKYPCCRKCCKQSYLGCLKRK